MSVKITRNGDVINAFANGFDLVHRHGMETLWMYDEYPLTREDVIELLPILQRFVETGSIEEVKDAADS